MEESSQKSFTLSTPMAIIIVGVIIAGAVYFGTSKGGTVAGTQVQQPTEQPAAQAVDVSNVKTAGDPFIGNQNAPATMAYWYDYQCPFCGRNEEQVMPQIVKNYVDTGKLKIVFKDFEFLGPDSQTLGQYSHAVWEAAPDKFYAWHKAVYDNQGTENTGWATQAKILSITKSVLDAATTDQVVNLVKTKGAEYQKIMDADKAEGSALGINGTPGSIIGKRLVEGAQPYAAFQTAIDAALK